MSNVAIQLKDVSKAFNGKKVLEKISFDVHAGEVLGLLGRSGTGKSVTLKLIVGLIGSDEGEIFIDEENIQQLERQELMRVRAKIGFLFQNAALFDSISLGKNLEFPLRRAGKSKSEIAEIVRTRLEEVGLEQDANKMPADLSGGMRKRAGLARALVLDPPIILVDEPSSGLDRITAGEIYELLGKLKQQKKTLIVVTHDAMGVRPIADRMCLIDQGKVLVCGPPEELEKDSNDLVRSLVTGGCT
ncbi:MAG: ATP-binding cassette domain-containing protein [Bryobacteraceae bacterium]